MLHSLGHWSRAGMVIAVIAGGGAVSSPAADPPSNPAPPALLEQALAGPLRGVDEVLFCTRSRYDDGHWYANIGYYCDDANRKAYAGNGRPDDGKLYRLNLRTGAVAVLLDAQGGSLRDPQLHYDGRKILFSYRQAGTDYYHLHEINVDGSGLKQLTEGDFDDYEPTYLPDGDIAFVSTRCNRWVNCWYTQVGIIYRCDGEGKDSRQQEVAGGAIAAVFAAKRDVLSRRCAGCHSVTPEAETAAKPLPYAKEWNERNKQLVGRPTGAYERVLLGDDPIARYSAHILLNFTRPELSPLLLAPLAKVSGGLERCGAVFRDQTDPDYQTLLAGLQAGRSLLDSEPRYGTPGFQPNPQYVREMRKYAILPATFDLAKDRLDVFQTDQRYWKSFWYQPAASAVK